jgi:hypothetical protein
VIAQPAYELPGPPYGRPGQPLANGQYQLDFRIYDAAVKADDTNVIWGPFYFDGLTAAMGHGPEVTLISGRFNVILGPFDASGRTIADAFQGPDRFLEIRVKGNRPILPRQQILTAPFAFEAQRAQEAQIAASVIKELADALCPPGSIMPFGGPAEKIPDGWLLCDGRAVSSTNYARLFSILGTAWGDGTFDANNVAENPPNPATDFNLPDLRGLFLRGANLDSTNEFAADPDVAARTFSRPGGNTNNSVGSFQPDQFTRHNHKSGTYEYLLQLTGYNTGRYWDNTATEVDSLSGGIIQDAGGSETRPKTLLSITSSH